MSSQKFSMDSIKVCIFIIVETDLIQELSRVNKLITILDHKNHPIENNFYISLRLIEGYQYTRNELWELAKKVKITSFTNPPFQFNQSDNLYIDEEKDILLDLNMDESFYTLRQSIMEIKTPGKSICSQPQIIGYYQVEHDKVVQQFLENLKLDTTKKYYASTIGIGLLGDNYDLLKTLYTYSLNTHLDHSLPYNISHYKVDNYNDDLLLT